MPAGCGITCASGITRAVVNCGRWPQFGADAEGADGDRDGGHLGKRPVGADPVADDLRQALDQDVQVVPVAADALLVR